MELTYQVLGADGKEYGPVTMEQLQAWIREGRVPPQQQIKRSDMSHWAAAEAFSELQALFGSSTPQPTAPSPARPQPTTADPAAMARVRGGASWFYWIAAFSLVNSVVAFTGSAWRFLLGLGVTQLIDGLGEAMSSSAGRVVALALNLIVAGMFVFFGVFARKAYLWAFVVGMALFALDGAIFLLAQDWLGVGFHAFALFCIFRGLAGARQLKAQ